MVGNMGKTNSWRTVTEFSLSCLLFSGVLYGLFVSGFTSETKNTVAGLFSLLGFVFFVSRTVFSMRKSKAFSTCISGVLLSFLWLTFHFVQFSAGEPATEYKDMSTGCVHSLVSKEKLSC